MRMGIAARSFSSLLLLATAACGGAKTLDPDNPVSGSQALGISAAREVSSAAASMILGMSEAVPAWAVDDYRPIDGAPTTGPLTLAPSADQPTFDETGGYWSWSDQFESGEGTSSRFTTTDYRLYFTFEDGPCTEGSASDAFFMLMTRQVDGSAVVTDPDLGGLPVQVDYDLDMNVDVRSEGELLDFPYLTSMSGTCTWTMTGLPPFDQPYLPEKTFSFNGAFTIPEAGCPTGAVDIEMGTYRGQLIWSGAAYVVWRFESAEGELIEERTFPLDCTPP